MSKSSNYQIKSNSQKANVPLSIIKSGTDLSGFVVANSGANWTRIPRQTGQRFQSKLDTDSTPNWTVK